METYRNMAERTIGIVMTHEDMYQYARKTLRFVREYGMVSWIDFEDGSRLCIDDNGKIWVCVI